MTGLSRAAGQVARRLADQNSDRMNGVRADAIWVLTVDHIVAGASPKGNPAIWVKWRGGVVPAKDYGASATPAAGDRVICVHLDDNQLVVIDRLAG